MGTRRIHSLEFKQRAVEASAQPGASIVGVAMTHGINANQLHKWRRQWLATKAEVTQPQMLPVTIAPEPASMPDAQEGSIDIQFSRARVSVRGRVDLDVLQVVLATPTLIAQQAEIEHLKLIIAKLRRMQFGQRSEKIDEMVGQLELALEELETGKAERDRLEEITLAEEAPGKPVRKPLPDHLPRDTVVHAPEQSCCPDCGGHLKPLGEDVSEVLDYLRSVIERIADYRINELDDLLPWNVAAQITKTADSPPLPDSD